MHTNHRFCTCMHRLAAPNVPSTDERAVSRTRVSGTAEGRSRRRKSEKLTVGTAETKERRRPENSSTVEPEDTTPDASREPDESEEVAQRQRRRTQRLTKVRRLTTGGAVETKPRRTAKSSMMKAPGTPVSGVFVCGGGNQSRKNFVYPITLTG